MSLIFRACPDCRAERAFEPYHATPGTCPDSPDGECPELSCTECGAALLTGPPPSRRPAPIRDLPSKVA
jgi:hypothetical protein